MDDPVIEQLLEDLKQADQSVRDQATQQLWQIWFQQKGAYGLDLLRRSQLSYESGDIKGAEAILSTLVKNQPDFAEAWNRRAVLHYIQGNYVKSLADCRRVTELNPIHFGAWHGMGLSYAALGKHRDAIRAFQKALEIQPYALINQKLILECTALLS